MSKSLIKPEIEARIDELMAKMTLEEKIGQLTQYGTSIYEAEMDIKDEQIRDGSIGAFLTLSGAEYINKLQRVAVEESRLGIPLLFGEDVIHGYKTIFPIPLAESCSWDMEAAELSAKIAAREAAAMGLHWTFAPMVDIAKDPRWGRIAEGAGEDPYLGCEIAKARVKGFQGDDFSDDDRVVACVKHFAAYGAVEGGRDYNTVDMSLQMLHDLYLPPFKAAVDAGVGTLMTAFNDVNGVPCTANKYLLTDVLRNEYKFDGFVVSDACSMLDMLYHGYSENRRKAAQQSILSGLDMDMASDIYPKELKGLVSDKEIDEKSIDESVRRVLRIKFLLGLFENPYVDTTKEKQVVLCDEHMEAARDIAKKSIVLLKNDNKTLPLNKNLHSIAVIGPLADDNVNPLGTWACKGDSEKVVTVLSGIKSAVGDKTQVHYAKGCEIEEPGRELFDQAIEIASRADAIIAVVGESKMMSGEAKSRSNIDLPGVQEELLKELCKIGKPLVVVLMNGRPLSIPWLANNVDAIVEAWHLGTQSGNAIADVIFGEYNPSGKLTVSFPYSAGQIPVHYNHPATGKPADENNRFTTKYADAPVKPLYPFGFGLSYTSFEYSDIKIENDKIKLDEEVKISANIKNVGNVCGEEIVQLYIADLFASRVRPVRELKGFEKIMLQPGESKRVEFEVPVAQFGFHNEKLEYIIEKGEFKAWVAPNSEEGLEIKFEVV